MPNSIGQEFIRQTRKLEQPPSPQDLGVPQPPLELPYPPDARQILLPPVHETHIPAIDLLTAIEARRTRRKYSSQPISLAELSFLLWCVQGVKRVSPRPATLRTVPSAGARHAFETYLLVSRVEGLQPGLYRYLAIEHSLIELDLSAELSEQIIHACLEQKQVRNAAVTFMWIAVLERMTWRYGERGYRYLHLDAGHVCQNLYLAAEAIDSGVCAIGAFDEEQLNHLLKLDGEQLFAIYLASLGKKERGAAE
ncbi:MAG: SagB/ThcOx family dehydrogenase [Anaerolineaceae bacterium]|nr:SagB/ThcOx family dehydrogenase [Anaerolineaceae bacterium]